jgi:hypothetical protein
MSDASPSPDLPMPLATPPMEATWCPYACNEWLGKLAAEVDLRAYDGEESFQWRVYPGQTDEDYDLAADMDDDPLDAMREMIGTLPNELGMRYPDIGDPDFDTKRDRYHEAEQDLIDAVYSTPPNGLGIADWARRVASDWADRWARSPALVPESAIDNIARNVERAALGGVEGVRILRGDSMVKAGLPADLSGLTFANRAARLRGALRAAKGLPPGGGRRAHWIHIRVTGSEGNTGPWSMAWLATGPVGSNWRHGANLVASDGGITLGAMLPDGPASWSIAAPGLGLIGEDIADAEDVAEILVTANWDPNGPPATWSYVTIPS